jgi:uroporphyrinogen decarboxylase
MDVKELKAEFGKDMVFCGGGCDTQTILPYGTPAEVRRHVSEQLRILSPGGGFIFSQVHNILAHIPPENVVAMFETVQEAAAVV